MSALDEVIMDRFQPQQLPLIQEAREELELLRERAFNDVRNELNNVPRTNQFFLECQRILRTDPERAKRMGLEWAL